MFSFDAVSRDVAVPHHPKKRVREPQAPKEAQTLTGLDLDVNIESCRPELRRNPKRK
jgi:hypothetical protein